MDHYTDKLIEKTKVDLEHIHDQRRLWLWASSIVFWAIIMIIFAWDWITDLHSKSIWWVIVSCMLLLSINWWYWTMRVLRKLLAHQALEYEILTSMLVDLDEIKQNVRELEHRSVDNSK